MHAPMMTFGVVYVVMPYYTCLKKDSDTLIRYAMVFHAKVMTRAGEPTGGVVRGLQYVSAFGVIV